MLLRQITYCLAVQEHRNFTKAAKVCHVTQPTLSQQIANFENLLGVQIFCRKVKPVRITLEGEILLKRAKEIDDLCQKFVALSRQLSSDVKVENLHSLSLPANLFQEKYHKIRS